MESTIITWFFFLLSLFFGERERKKGRKFYGVYPMPWYGNIVHPFLPDPFFSLSIIPFVFLFSFLEGNWNTVIIGVLSCFVFFGEGRMMGTRRRGVEGRLRVRVNKESIRSAA